MDVVISVGNTDNRLTQKEWSDFVYEINNILERCCKIHFFGGPANYSMYQNACWWINIDKTEIHSIRSVLMQIRINFKQDSIAWLSGKTEFI